MVPATDMEAGSGGGSSRSSSSNNTDPKKHPRLQWSLTFKIVAGGSLLLAAAAAVATRGLGAAPWHPSRALVAVEASSGQPVTATSSGWMQKRWGGDGARRAHGTTEPVAKTLEISSTISTLGIYTRQRQVGAYIPMVMVFQPCLNIVKQWKEQIKDRMDLGRTLVLVMEFNEGPLQMILDGAYNKDLAQIAQLMNEDGRDIWVRILHEMNGAWYPWCTYGQPGNTIDKFKESYRHIVDHMRKHGAGANVKFQQSYNMHSSNGDTRDFEDWWVGKEYVDMIMVTAYNRAGTDIFGNEREWMSFDDLMGRSYDRIARLDPDLPIGVSECSSTDLNGHEAKAEWYRNVFRTIQSGKYPRLQQINFFLEDKHHTFPWDIHSEEEAIGLGDGLRSAGFKAIDRKPFYYDPALDVVGADYLDGAAAEPMAKHLKKEQEAQAAAAKAAQKAAKKAAKKKTVAPVTAKTSSVKGATGK